MTDTISAAPSVAPTIGRANSNGAAFSAELHPDQPTTFAKFVVAQRAHGQDIRHEIQAQVEEQGQVKLRIVWRDFLQVVVVDEAGNQLFPPLAP